MSAGWLFLAAMIVAYGGANLLQSIAAAKTDLHLEFHPRLLLRLGRHKAYLWGIGVQTLGSLLAFVARRDLPLFLLQAAVAAGPRGTGRGGGPATARRRGTARPRVARRRRVRRHPALGHRAELLRRAAAPSPGRRPAPGEGGLQVVGWTHGLARRVLARGQRAGRGRTGRGPRRCRRAAAGGAPAATPRPLPRGPRVTRGALRERSGRAGVPRHRDPDAAGRSRPRA